MEEAVLPAGPIEGRRFRLLGRVFFRGSLDQAVALCLAWVGRRPRRGAVLHIANVHTLIEARRNAALARAQDEADLLLPDGRPLSLAARLLGAPSAGQVRGPDLMRRLALDGRAAGLRHYYYGGVAGAAAAVAGSLEAKAPGLSVAGAESPPFGDPSDADLADLVGRLSASSVDFLWLGLGAPRQEVVMARLKRLACPCVMLGVGAAFDYESGAKREAPAFLQKAGLEWLFRLLSEPGRLFRRYASTNPRFLWLFLGEAFGLGPWAQGALERILRLGALGCLAAAAFIKGSAGSRLGLCLLAVLVLRLAALARRAASAECA